MTHLLNDADGFLALKKLLVDMKIEKRKLIDKFNQNDFIFEWTDKDRIQSKKKNIYEVTMPKQER